MKPEERFGNHLGRAEQRWCQRLPSQKAAAGLGLGDPTGERQQKHQKRPR